VAWHGANWTFVVFGAYHGFLLILVLAFEKRRKKFEKKHNLKGNELYKWSRRFLTFILCAIGMVLWRSASLGDFIGTMAQIGSGFGSFFKEGFYLVLLYAVPSSVILFVREWVQEYDFDMHFFHNKNTFIRLLSIVLMLAWIIFAGELEGASFIYFQF
jgi:D-alanyl-lipoteichoic acid acyltransferase DltB (MBOAT superfamily)